MTDRKKNFAMPSATTSKTAKIKRPSTVTVGVASSSYLSRPKTGATTTIKEKASASQARSKFNKNTNNVGDGDTTVIGKEIFPSFDAEYCQVAYGNYLRALLEDCLVDDKIEREETEIDLQMSELGSRFHKTTELLDKTNKRLKDISFVVEQKRQPPPVAMEGVHRAVSGRRTRRGRGARTRGGRPSPPVLEEVAAESGRGSGRRARGRGVRTRGGASMEGPEGTGRGRGRGRGRGGPQQRHDRPGPRTIDELLDMKNQDCSQFYETWDSSNAQNILQNLSTTQQTSLDKLDTKNIDFGFNKNSGHQQLLDAVNDAIEGLEQIKKHSNLDVSKFDEYKKSHDTWTEVEKDRFDLEALKRDFDVDFPKFNEKLLKEAMEKMALMIENEEE